MRRLFLSLFTILAVIIGSLGADAKRTPHVIVVGFDGWGAYSVPTADMPHLAELMNRGAWTLKKRSVLPSSSAVNWASMFMGVGTEGHGYTQWGSQTPDTPSIALSDNGIFPTIFTIAREQRPKYETAVFHEWDGIKHLVDTLAVGRHVHIDPAPDGTSEAITEAFVNYVKESKPTLAWVIYEEPDAVGHKAGHNTPEYYATVARLDGYLGRIIDAAKEAGIYDDTVFIVTADHGGIDKRHGGITMAEMETPFIIAGPGVKPVGEFKSAMMQYDVSATIAALLDLKQPQPWVGRPVKEILK